MPISSNNARSALVSLAQALTVATSLFVLASCSTTAPAPTTPDNPDSSVPTPATAGTETPEHSEPEAVPATASAPGEPPQEQERASQPEQPADKADGPVESARIVRAPAAPAPAAPSTGSAPAPEPPSTVALNGRVRLDISRVEDVDADSVRDTVIYFRPAGLPVTPEPDNFEIVTRRKRLLPDVLVIPVGSTVAFPNQDDILHNVFSVSSAADFDLGLYGEGETKSHTFVEPGLAVIYCNVHHAMRADVLVVDTPFFTQAGPDGRFSIKGIEAKTGELVAWHPRAGFLRRQISLPAEPPLELELALVRPRIPDHLDKSGQPYRPERPNER